MSFIARIIGVAMVLTSTSFALAQKVEVDLMLVLASDVSRSVDAKKFQLQREGYLAAIQDPRVVEVMTTGRNRRIALMFAEWSNATQYQVVVDWQVIDSLDAARRFISSLAEAPRSFANMTSISYAIYESIRYIESAPFTSERRIIDISGDGTNNDGRSVTEARDEALGKDIRINGLVILTDLTVPSRMNNPWHTNPPGGLPNYFRENVIGGYGSFVMVAENHDSFGEAIRKKMIQEIAQID